MALVASSAGRDNHYDLGRYFTFQYQDQNAYQYPYPEDFNADTLFHVSVSVKRICLFYLTLSCAYIISFHSHAKSTPLIQNVVTSIFFKSYIRVLLQEYDVLEATIDLIYDETLFRFC